MRSRSCLIIALTLVLLGNTIAIDCPTAAAPYRIGAGLRLSTWHDLLPGELFTSLRLTDKLSIELGIVAREPALAFNALHAKLYWKDFQLNLFQLRPFIGAGTTIANEFPYAIVPISLRAFGGLDSSIYSLSLFTEAGLGYDIACCPGCPPAAFLALGVRLDL